MITSQYPSARDIALAFNLQSSRIGYHGPCPSCGYPTGFTVVEKHGNTLFYCHAGGCSSTDIISALMAKGLWKKRHNVATVATVAKRPYKVHFPQKASAKDGDTQDGHRLASALWSQSQIGKNTLVEVYLSKRGILCELPVSIRFLPLCKHTPSGKYYPAMLAIVTGWDGQGLLGIHRTYLVEDGSSKAPVTPNKMILGAAKGGSVHLAKPEKQLAIAEGIETALSIYQSTGIPTWAALSASGIQNLVLPPWPQAKDVIICADHDSVGLSVAYKAAERWSREGRNVKIVIPPEVGMDFNDLLLKGV